MLKKQLIVNKNNTEYVESLPKIYLVKRGSKAEIFELAFTGELVFDKMVMTDVPLVYQYDERVSYDDVYVLRKIIYAAPGDLIGWTTDKNEAESWKNEGE